MSSALPFRRLVHCDWSVAPAKRWRADAARDGGGWRVSAPRPVGDLPAFVDGLFDPPGPVLAGFDLPIGLPDVIGRRSGSAGFRDLLPRLGVDEPWRDFFDVNRDPATVTIHRPFFPDRWTPGTTAAALTDALAVTGLDDLRRRCERRRPGRRAATPLFWTVGPAQVGKAAISGWRDVFQPSLARGATLWPFDGSLADLAGVGGPVLAETYPGEAYAHAGIAFGPRRSKRRADDRREAAAGLMAWCRTRGIEPDGATRRAVDDGFAAFGAAGEDAFDALAGLLGMVEVAEGRRAAAPPDPALSVWEGWITGQSACTAAPQEEFDA